MSNVKVLWVFFFFFGQMDKQTNRCGKKKYMAPINRRKGKIKMYKILVHITFRFLPCCQLPNRCAFTLIPLKPRPGGSVVSMSVSWPGGWEFDTRLRQTFFLAYFCLSLLQKHVRKVVGGFGKKVVLVLVWESQETHVRHWLPWYDFSSSSGVKPQYNEWTNQPLILSCFSW